MITTYPCLSWDLPAFDCVSAVLVAVKFVQLALGH
jgi:hypothetical protein